MKHLSRAVQLLLPTIVVALLASRLLVVAYAAGLADDDEAADASVESAIILIDEPVGSAALKIEDGDAKQGIHKRLDDKPAIDKPAIDKPSTDQQDGVQAATSKHPSEVRRDARANQNRASSKAALRTSAMGIKQATPESRPRNTGKLQDLDAADDANSLRKKSSGASSQKVSDSENELTLEAQQKKDEGECPGSEASKKDTSKPLSDLHQNDVPLDQDEHPFDAPSAKSDTEEESSPAIVKGELEDPLEHEAPVEYSPSQNLQMRINMCLAHYYANKENLARRSPWAVMHTILPFGVETDIVAGNRNVNAIGWMCYNGVCKTQRVFQSTKSGFRTNVGPGVQGHEGQFLAILAQSGVPRDFPIMVGKTRFTVSDLIRYEMVTCKEKSELTFKLIGLSHYLSPRQTWRDEDGHVWNLEKLVREELEQPVVGAACGGTHRLMGLSYALMMRRRYKEPIVNHWARADAYVKDFVQYAWSLQNPDGSFSTDWFEGRANEPDMERKVQTTGHILEWLVFTLSAEELQDPRVTKSVEFIMSQVYENRDKDWPIGPRGHALRALALYNQRVYGAPVGHLKNYLAKAGYFNQLR